MTKKEIAFDKVKRAADKIIKNYLVGYLSREDAHDRLTRLNNTCFEMYDFELMRIDPGETQEYIHALQEKYTTVYV